MKKITLIALILIALSCTKEEDGPPKTYAILKMNVNGQELSGDQLYHGSFPDVFTLTFYDKSTLDIAGVNDPPGKYATKDGLSFLWAKSMSEYYIINATSGEGEVDMTSRELIYSNLSANPLDRATYYYKVKATFSFRFTDRAGKLVQVTGSIDAITEQVN